MFIAFDLFELLFSSYIRVFVTLFVQHWRRHTLSRPASIPNEPPYTYRALALFGLLSNFELIVQSYFGQTFLCNILNRNIEIA